MNTPTIHGFRILRTFPVAYVGWELDEVGYIVAEKSGRRRVVLTSHGTPYLAKPADLRAKIRLYARWQAKTEKALKLLRGAP